MPCRVFQAALIALLILAALPSHSAARACRAGTFAAPAAVLDSLRRPHAGPLAGRRHRQPRSADPLPQGSRPGEQDFEGPTTSWTEAGGDAQYSLVAHQRVRGGAHGGQGCEWLQVVGQGGSTVLVAHDIGRPWVIDELRPSIWIYADRPGIQFFAEVTLPRTLDPRAAKPLTTNVFGTAYTTAGRWQQLEIVDFPRMVARQVRILRSQLAINVDGREAFVSRVLLNIYGGPGVTNVWTDDLEVFGHVPSVDDAAAPAAGPALAIAASPAGLAGSRQRTAVAGNLPVASGQLLQPPPREVKLAGSVLKVNDYPIFPRCIEYRGEKLAFLKQLGFNTIWLRQTPSPAFLSEARQLGLWLVCPPPDTARRADPQATIGPEFEPVLVWDLGHGLTGESLDANRQRAERVRLADSRVSRPLICAPVNNLRSYSRGIVNLLLIDRRPLGTSLEMPDYGTGSAGNRCWPCRALRSGPRCKPRRARACGGSSPRSLRARRRPRSSAPSRSGCWSTRPSPPEAAACCSFPTPRWRPRTAKRGSG